MKKFIKQFFKFSIVGGTSFFIDYGLLIVLTEVFHCYYLISSCISFSVSVIFNYYASMKFVFKSRDDLGKRTQFLIFFALSVIGLAINQWLLEYLVVHLAIHYMIAKLIASIIVSIYNFLSRKVFLEEGDTKLRRQIKYLRYHRHMNHVYKQR